MASTAFGKFLSVALPAAQIAAPLVSGYLQYSAGKDAAKQQRRIADANAERTLAEASEAARQMQRQKQANIGRLAAMTGASGFSRGGTNVQYENEFSKEAQREIDWTQKAASSRADIERRTGKAEADVTSGLATQALFGGVASGLGNLYTVGNERSWW